MIRQPTFMVVAEFRPDAKESLRALLTTLNREPGLADPDSAIVPFGKLPLVHVARLVQVHEEASR